MSTEPERRRTPREPVSLLIQYRFDTFEPFMAEYISDISERGLRIQDPDVVRPPGTVVYVQFINRDGTRLIEGLCNVVWVHVQPERAMALEFVDFDDESLDLIRRLITAEPFSDIPTEESLRYS